MLRNWSEKLEAKFPSTTLCYSLARISRLDDAFSGIIELEASPVEGRQLQQKDKERRKTKGRKKKYLDLCACPSKSVIKRDASRKKGMLSCRLYHVEKVQNVQKMCFCQKSPWVIVCRFPTLSARSNRDIQWLSKTKDLFNPGEFVFNA